MTKITYTQSTVAERPTFYSQKFGSLLGDTFQASVDQSESGTWNAWFINFSRNSETCFCFGLKSKSAATRWANDKLRERGV